MKWWHRQQGNIVSIKTVEGHTQKENKVIPQALLFQNKENGLNWEMHSTLSMLQETHGNCPHNSTDMFDGF
jgi:hypothetical protein